MVSQRRQRHAALRRLALRRRALALGRQGVGRDLCSQDVGSSGRPGRVVPAAALGTAGRRVRVDVLHEGGDVREARERE